VLNVYALRDIADVLRRHLVEQLQTKLMQNMFKVLFLQYTWAILKHFGAHMFAKVMETCTQG